MNRVIVFDCDGTILDTFTLIEHIVFATFKEVNPNYPLTIEEAHSFFGPFINESFVKYSKDEKELKKYIDTYNYYASILTEKYILPYPNILEALTYLKKIGYSLVVASNKISEEVLRGLKICKIDHLIDYVVGAEMMTSVKPAPDCLIDIKNKYNVENLLMVGDTYNDILAGKNANCFTCGVTWCKTNYESFKLWHADEIIADPLELKKIGEKYANRL